MQRFRAAFGYDEAEDAPGAEGLAGGNATPAAGDRQARQQARHYQLLSELQALVKDLPRLKHFTAHPNSIVSLKDLKDKGQSFKDAGAHSNVSISREKEVRLPRLNFQIPSKISSQQRLSYTILSDLALALLDGTVFEIVQGLLEIQHLTERNLYNQRLKLQNEHRALKQEILHKHREAQQSCRPHNLPLLKAAQQREMEATEQRIHEEQQMMDKKIVLELDQKVVDQQSTLEKAGVSGFYITTNPQELSLQMNLLDLIQKLQQKPLQPRKTFC